MFYDYTKDGPGEVIRQIPAERCASDRRYDSVKVDDNQSTRIRVLPARLNWFLCLDGTSCGRCALVYVNLGIGSEVISSLSSHPCALGVRSSRYWYL